MMSARFWVWWHEGYVKITLKPHQMLKAGYFNRHEEGWSSYCESWRHDGVKVTRVCYCDGSDCDGRLSQMEISRCDVEHLADVRLKQQGTYYDELTGMEHQVDDLDAPAWPDWQEVQSSQRDYAAEAMNY